MSGLFGEVFISFLFSYVLLSQDLSKLNRDPTRVMFLSAHAKETCLQPENAVVVKPWKLESDDTTLLDLLPFFECKCFWFNSIYIDLVMLFIMDFRSHFMVTMTICRCCTLSPSRHSTCTSLLWWPWHTIWIFGKNKRLSKARTLSSLYEVSSLFCLLTKLGTTWKSLHLWSVIRFLLSLQTWNVF